MEVGEVIQVYDQDKLFPAWGFGGRMYNGSVSHCFNLNGNDGSFEVKPSWLKTSRDGKDISHFYLYSIAAVNLFHLILCLKTSPPMVCNGVNGSCGLDNVSTESFFSMETDQDGLG